MKTRKTKKLKLPRAPLPKQRSEAFEDRRKKAPKHKNGMWPLDDIDAVWEAPGDKRNG